MRFSLRYLAICALLPIVTHAQTDAPSSTATKRLTLGLAVDASVELGGDDFLEVAFTNGATQTLRAGQGGTLAIGGIVRPSSDSPLSLRGTVGVKFVTTAADDANIMFTRIPLELVGSYQLPTGVRAGAGVVFHTMNRFNGDGFLPDESYSASPGFTAEIGYKVLALTYTTMTYTPQGGPSFNGSSIGVQLLWTPTRRRR